MEPLKKKKAKRPSPKLIPVRHRLPEQRYFAWAVVNSRGELVAVRTRKVLAKEFAKNRLSDVWSVKRCRVAIIQPRGKK